jgi:DNA-binding transcriptional MerR regulator
MQIGELSDTAGVPIDTIRFYEKRGLLNGQHFIRKENRYRDYAETAVDRLRLIRQAQMIGLTLSEICQFIDAWESDALTLEQKVAFLEHKIEDIDARIAQLEQTKGYVRKKIEGLLAECAPAPEPVRAE